MNELNISEIHDFESARCLAKYGTSWYLHDKEVLNNDANVLFFV
jgi:hypothetical protein